MQNTMDIEEITAYLESPDFFAEMAIAVAPGNNVV
jgi:hypothetical protein